MITCADDAFTPQVEPPVPFTLGVRVKNTGGGTATATTIESAQPKIVENQQGLLIGFQILDSFVNDQPASKTLLINFGDVAPGKSKVGRWNMVTTLSGKFVDFSASYTHDRPGGTFQMLSNDVAYLKLSSVKVANSANYVRSAAGTKGLIIDIRNYPSEFMVFALGSLLVEKETEFVDALLAFAGN